MIHLFKISSSICLTLFFINCLSNSFEYLITACPDNVIEDAISSSPKGAFLLPKYP